MIVSIMQPAYLPWLGYFDRIARSDLHIVLDTVQLEHQTKTAFTNRNKVRTSAGWSWLTVPVRTAGEQPRIADVQLADPASWVRKHRETLRQAYGRAPYWNTMAPFVAEFYHREWPTLAPLLDETTSWLRNALALSTPVVAASTLGVNGSKGDLVVALCRAVGAGTYLSGPFGRDYLDPLAFETADIRLTFHDYVHPTYSQTHGEFVPYMSVVDLLANHGPQSTAILRSAVLPADV
jgi:hypothetical protein